MSIEIFRRLEAARTKVWQAEHEHNPDLPSNKWKWWVAWNPPKSIELFYGPGYRRSKTLRAWIARARVFGVTVIEHRQKDNPWR